MTYCAPLCLAKTAATFTIWTARSHGRERQGERAYRQGRNLTMTMAIHVHLSPINVFLSSWWCNECSFGYSVTSRHFRLIRTQYMLPLSTMWNRHILHVSRLKATMKADISRPEIQRCMDNRNETKALKIPIGEFRTQQLLEALRRNIDTVTAAKCANGYHFVQTYLPRCKMFK